MKPPIEPTIEQTKTLGETLRGIRLGMGYTVQDISITTNLRPIQIRAIESNSYDQLPGMIYAVGFVRVYAEALDLDADAAVNQFKFEYAEVMAAEAEAAAQKEKKKAKDERLIDTDPYADNRLPSIPVILAALFFFVICLGIWNIFEPDRSNVNQIMSDIPPPPKIETAASDIVIPVTTDDEATADVEPVKIESPVLPDIPPLQKLKPENKPLALKDTTELQKRVNRSRVKLRAIKSSWVQISDQDGRPLFKKVLRTGDEYFLPNQAGLKLSTSNAGGFEIYVDGKKVLPIGVDGDILRGISMNANELKSRDRAPTRTTRR